MVGAGPLFFLVYVQRTAWLLLCTLAFVVLYPLTVAFQSAFAPRLLRLYLQSCGGAFVKLGQLLSMRYDLLPQSYQRELAKLLDTMPQLPFKKIRAVIEADLRRPLAACFARVEERALGAASIAQVHAAELLTGEQVVIKVMRPRVQLQFEVDFQNLYLLTRFIDFLAILAPIDLTGLARETARLVRQELDFRRESRNAHLLHEKMASDDIAHKAPRVYFELSGQRVLTLERFEGIWVKDILAAIHSNDQRQLAQWQAQGVDPQRIARLLFRSIMEQCYRHRVYHADPHAANLVLTPDGYLGFIDFGMVGVLDERLWAQQFRIFEALSSGGIHTAYESLLATIEPLDSRDLSEFETEVKSRLSDWVITAQSPASSGAEKSASLLLLQLGDAMRRAQLRLPWNVLSLYRVQIVSDMIVYTLYPRLDPIRELGLYFVDERRRQLQLFLENLSAGDNATAALNTAQAVRRAAGEVVDWLRFTLPYLGRRYSDQASRLELTMALLAHYVRLCAIFVAGGVVAARWSMSHAAWQPSSEAVKQLLVNWGGLIAGASAVLAFVIGQIRRRLLDPK